MYQLSGKRIVIVGGSGFLGHSMANQFSNLGAKVTILSRSKLVATGSWTHQLWDGRTLGDWVECLVDCDAIVNLAGRSVNCIKTPDHQDEILRSRVESTRALGQAIRTIRNFPPVWIQMSTAHIYGDPPSAMCDEFSEEGIGFAPNIGRAWERAFSESKLPEQRGVIFRTSFVIGRDQGAGSGALGTLGLLANVGLGGKVGKGTQGMSWIHQQDLNSLFIQAIVDPRMSGVYVASSPNPVSQAEFMRTLRKVIGMPIGLPAFEWMVRIGAPLIFRTDPELALYGRYVVSKRLAEEGFQFSFPTLEPALLNLYKK